MKNRSRNSCKGFTLIYCTKLKSLSIIVKKIHCFFSQELDKNTNNAPNKLTAFKPAIFQFVVWMLFQSVATAD